MRWIAVVMVFVCGVAAAQGPPESLQLRRLKGSLLTVEEGDFIVENLYHLFTGADGDAVASPLFSLYLPGESGLTGTDCDAAAEGKQVRIDTSTWTLNICDGSAWAEVGGGGGGSPGGSGSEVQYRFDASTFGAVSELTYAASTGLLSYSPVLDEGTGDEVGFDLSGVIVNKAVSGTATALQIRMIDTLSPGTTYGIDLNDADFDYSILLPQKDSAVSPALAWGDGGFGIMANAHDSLQFVFDSFERFQMTAASFLATSALGPKMWQEAASATNPTFSPRGVAGDGLGSGATGQVSLIVGDDEAVRATAVASSVSTWDFWPAATGGIPEMKIQSTDDDVSVRFQPKGNGDILIGLQTYGPRLQSGMTGAGASLTTPVFTFNSSTGSGMGGDLATGFGTVSIIVGSHDVLQVKKAGSGTATVRMVGGSGDPTIEAEGGGNEPLVLKAKGSGNIILDSTYQVEIGGCVDSGKLSAAPSGVECDTYWDTDLTMRCWHNGTNWVQGDDWSTTCS